MRKIRIVLVIALVTVIGTSVIMANKAVDGDGICIAVSPQTLVLSKDTGCVTVHTNVDLDLVDVDSLELEGITPYLTKADNLGDLVAKFDIDEVKALVLPGQTTLTLTLTGKLIDGTAFAASDTIAVKE